MVAEIIVHITRAVHAVHVVHRQGLLCVSRASDGRHARSAQRARAACAPPPRAAHELARDRPWTRPRPPPAGVTPSRATRGTVRALPEKYGVVMHMEREGGALVMERGRGVSDSGDGRVERAVFPRWRAAQR